MKNKISLPSINEQNLKWISALIFLILVTFNSLSFSECLKDFHVQQKFVSHKIPASIMDELDHLAQEGNPAKGWKKIGQLGDPYAAVAAKVLAKKPVFPASFYHQLILTHWNNVNSKDVVVANFESTAQQHFRQYVELLHSGYWPDSDQILLSYLQAVRDHKMADLTVFDAAWDAAGLNTIRTWQELNHFPKMRTIYPSRACYDIDSIQAKEILLKDFANLPFKFIFKL